MRDIALATHRALYRCRAHPSERVRSSIAVATRKWTITYRTTGMNTKVYSWTNRCTLTSDIALTMTCTHTGEKTAFE